MKTQIQTIGRWTAFSVVGLAVAGVSCLSRDFAKYKIGPAYLLEVIFLMWLAGAIVGAKEPPDWKKVANILWAPMLFFIWGSGLLLFDIGQSITQSNPIQLSRVMQHAVIFVYPLLWMSAGAWIVHTFPQYYQWIAYATFFTIRPDVYNREVANISVGPIIAVPWMKDLYMVNASDKTSKVPLCSLKIFVLTILTCLPFWVMWFSTVQRTCLLIFIMLVFSVPWVLARHPGDKIRAVKTIGLATLIYIVGQVCANLGILAYDRLDRFKFEHLSARVETSLPPAPIAAASSHVNTSHSVDATSTKTAIRDMSNNMRRHMLKAMQHGDDGAVAGNSQPFQMRTRRFMWSNALDEWRLSPVVGIGMIPEVPSYISPGIPNVYRDNVADRAPLSGPHNSYLSVLARTGVIGTFLLLLILSCYVKHARTVIRMSRLDLSDLILLFVPLNGAVYAVMNSGFESPHNCVLLWLFNGMLFAKANELKRNKPTEVARGDKADR